MEVIGRESSEAKEINELEKRESIDGKSH